MLTDPLAQEIARDTTAVIGHNVLITNSDGVVIGSGDPSRIGSFHEASVAVIRSQELAMHNSSEASRLRGVRPGVTLPLIVDGQGVGTVGITGAPAQVRPFGLVVKRQIEILLRESVMLRSRVLRERALEDLLADIGSYDADLLEPDFVVFRADELGYSFRMRRAVIIVDLVPTTAPRRTRTRRGLAGEISVLRPEVLRTLREVFADPQDIATSMVASGRFAVLHAVPEGLASHEVETATVVRCQRVVEALRLHLELTARTAVAGPAVTVSELHDAYHDACDALRLGMRVAPSDSVYAIGDLRAHQILAAVNHRSRVHLTANVLDKLREQPDWPVLRATVIAWCENSFSQVRTAQALHIHRNTLVYRLNKIVELSGRKLRSPRAGVFLYLASLADQLDDTR